MAFEFREKIALLTGATGKLAGEVAIELARAGANLALHYHTHGEEALALADQIEKMGRKCSVYRADLTQTKGIRKMTDAVLDDFGGVDILINSASKFVVKSLSQTEDELWQQMLDLHLTAPYQIVRSLEQNFRQRQGAIINFTDIWGLHPRKTFFAYSVSKGALVSLTRAQADEFAPTTTVNAIAPGILHFDETTPPAQQEKIIARIPLGRTGRVEEVAQMTLAVIANRYMTGQVVCIDGGRTLHL
jgi:pteridine reductase